MIKAPVRAIAAAIDASATLWSDARLQARVGIRDAVSRRTGYAKAMVDYAFDRLFGSLRRDTIEDVIEDELGSLDALDGLVRRNRGLRATALPVGRVCIVSSRTTVGVAVIPAIFALCAKCDVLVKDREDGLVGAFLETLATTLPGIRSSIDARRWSGDKEAETLDRKS